MLRTLKRIGARFVPEMVKRRVRARLFGYRAAAVSLPWTAEPAARAGFHTVRIQGLRPILFPDAVLPELHHHLADNGAAIEETYAFVREAGARPGVLYDVGAHTGYFTWVFAAARLDNRAMAVEPSRAAVQTVRDCLAANGFEDRVMVRTAAVSDRPGTTRAWVDPHDFVVFGEREGEPGYDLEITTVDDEVARTGLAPTLLKIDVEGHEGAVLRGARETLRIHRPTVFLELHSDQVERAGGKTADVLEPLVREGYRFHTLAGAKHGAAWFANHPAAVLHLVARPGTPSPAS